jgi:hypothetical protein
MKFYKKKNAIEQASLSNKLVANCETTKYCIFDNYFDFLTTIKTSSNPCFYEFISGTSPVCAFFDIEIYDSSQYFNDYETIIEICKSCIKNSIPDDYILKTIILKSHSDIKRSFHLIFRIFDNENCEYLFNSVKELKELWNKSKLNKFKDTNNKYMIDPSVYREGLFRTIYSSKLGENRPLVKSELSEEFDDIETFICYRSENFKIIDKPLEYIDTSDIEEINITDSNIVNIPEELTDDDKNTIKKFVTKEFHHFPNSVRDIFIDKEHNCIIVALNERYCPFLDREHRSNNQYIIIDTTSSKQKCHNTECNEHKYGELKLESYPKEINEIIKRCLRVNKQELELIELAIVIAQLTHIQQLVEASVIQQVQHIMAVIQLVEDIITQLVGIMEESLLAEEYVILVCHLEDLQIIVIQQLVEDILI